MARTFSTLAEFVACSGQTIGTSGWRTVDQNRIDLFADATDDQQWIHTDPDRAAVGPFGTTIAHGYLTLALLPAFVTEIYAIDGLGMSINYGAERVRFPAPLPVDSRIRAHARLLGTTDSSAGTRATLEFTVEREGGERPVCVAEVIYLLAPAA